MSNYFYSLYVLTWFKQEETKKIYFMWQGGAYKNINSIGRMTKDILSVKWKFMHIY